MHVRFQTIKIHNLQIIAFDGFLPLRGENFRWADLVSGNLKEVKATSPATVVLWSAIVNLSGIVRDRLSTDINWGCGKAWESRAA